MSGSFTRLKKIAAERTSPLVAWVGSGPSVEAGIPSWKELRSKLLKTLSDKISTFDGDEQAKLRSVYFRVKDLDDYWLAFDGIRKALGDATYRASVKEALAPIPRCPVPRCYELLWDLPFQGAITLNLDRLLTKAYHNSKRSELPAEFNGHEVGRRASVLQSPRPFILNLHGDYEDSESWVLCQTDLDKIASPTSTKFIETCLMSKTNVLIGLSADDKAVRTYFEQLRKDGLELGSHFWITDRRDLETDQWAEQIGLQVIRYQAAGKDHSNLTQLLEEMYATEPSEEQAVPIHHRETSLDVSIPSHAALMKIDSAEELRKVLNAKATEILTARTTMPDQDRYAAYRDFCKEYDEPIHRAWYVSTVEGRNTLAGYLLETKIASGAFGDVYRARSSDGEQRAVKVLKEEIRHSQERLQCFRRGVRSMRILEEKRLEGMVGCKEASEIPAFVAMEWVPGPTLKQVVEAKQLEDWGEALSLLSELTSIIKTAHGLPERVLHRDIRPRNIMLDDYWSDPIDYRVKVLDFDLSWHRGSHEESIRYDPSAISYLAPEQTVGSSEFSTRHASVDSFGLGMTFFFVVAGRDPITSEQEHVGWIDSVREHCENAYDGCKWSSVPRRFARLIVRATRTRQPDRWDVNQIFAELSRLLAALRSPAEVESAELWAEELMSRSRYSKRYSWDDDDLSATSLLGAGGTFTLRGDESKGVVQLELEWISKGAEPRSGLWKYVKKQYNTILEQLTAAGWTNQDSTLGDSSIYVKVQIASEEIANDSKRVLSSIQNLGQLLSF